MMRKERRKANALGHLDTALVDDEETDAEHLAGCGGAHMLNRYEVLLFNDGNVKEERRKEKWIVRSKRHSCVPPRRDGVLLSRRARGRAAAAAGVRAPCTRAESPSLNKCDQNGLG